MSMKVKSVGRDVLCDLLTDGRSQVLRIGTHRKMYMLGRVGMEGAWNSCAVCVPVDRMVQIESPNNLGELIVIIIIYSVVITSTLFLSFTNLLVNKSFNKERMSAT